MSATVAQEARYILTDIEANNNKFWTIRLFNDGTCETQWGRVGEEGQSKRFPNAGEKFFASKRNEKERKGYQPQRTLEGSQNMTRARVAEVAELQIETNSPETLDLVRYLAQVNVHNILQATNLSYDSGAGTFMTPLGVVTTEAITEARTLLSRIGTWVYEQDYDNIGFLPTLNTYLMLIPQNVGRGRPHPRLLFPDVQAIQNQSQILDALEASLAFVQQQQADRTAGKPVPKLFEAKLSLVDSEAESARIRAKYHAGLNRKHACAHLQIKRIFRVEIEGMEREFAEKGRELGNVWELWHGTKASNLLSILKSGFVIAPDNAPHVTGRMFGNGVYFSDQSTKSLNYAYGYWDGKVEENCFMFLCAVAMGKAHTPKTWNTSLPAVGSDSTFARGGKSGILHNEMIVYRTNQIKPLYLVEFEPCPLADNK